MSPAEIEAKLQNALEPVLSSRRTAAEAAAAIAALSPERQRFALHWVEVLARTSAELAFQLACAVADALAVLDTASAERWLIAAVDAYDRDGLYRGTEVLRNPGAFAGPGTEHAVSFEQAAPVLRLFVQGLTGRAMAIEAAAHAYTDTETIFLPASIDACGSPRDNFLLYKATAALLWAQSRYGTFDVDIADVVAAHADPSKALTLLNALEGVRLDAQLARVLPGLAGDVQSLLGPSVTDPRVSLLAQPTATVHDSVALLGALYSDASQMKSRLPSVLEPALAAAARAARIAREKAALQSALARIVEEQQKEHGDAVPCFTLEAPGRSDDGGSDYILKLDGLPIALPDDLAQLAASIEQDLGEIPADYLTPGSATPGRADDREADLEVCAAAAHVYDEWDYQRRHYRKRWCEVREQAVEPGDPAFADATARKHAGRIAQLRRTFELLRAEERTLRRQPDGDDIDLDALTEAYVEMQSGAELDPLLFTRRQRAERDLAALFMIDMSGSTKGWINDAEREALVMLCEALEALGDRYAIYGFSGATRKKCAIFRIKAFDEPYDTSVRRRIAGIEAHDYTRMGAAIRHLTSVLAKVDARTRLLVTLSDGRPDDFSDNYRGEYGIEDTRQALLEAHRAGVKPFCITIDREAHAYLPHMYGAVSWTLVQDVAKLPFKVAEIYARLTR